MFTLFIRFWAIFFPNNFNTVRQYFLFILELYTYKAFRHVETLFVQGRNLYLAGLQLVGGK